MPATTNDHGTSTRPPSRWLAPVALATLLAVAAASLAAFDAYVARHRDLHVVNGFSVPVTVRLDDGRKVEVPPNDRVTLTIAEGPHEASISSGGRALSGGMFEVSSSVLARLFKKPVFVLNAGCGATLIWEETVYGKKTATGGMRLYVGQPFVAFDDVDYAFVQFPTTLKMAGVPIKKTRVEVFPLTTEQVMTAPLNLVSVSDRLTLAEAHLQLDPAESELVNAYFETSEQHSQGERAREFLARHAISLPGRQVR